MRIVFYNKEGKESGGIFVRFTDPPEYMIGFCSNWKTFNNILPEQQDRIWTISRKLGALTLKCNDEEMVSSNPSDEVCQRWPDWRTYWNRDIVKVKFTKMVDKASREFRIQLPPSEWIQVPHGRKFKIDLQREPLEIFTDSKLGSDDQVRVLFFNGNNDPAGGIYISFSSPPRYMVPYCALWKKFFWKDAKYLRTVPQNKVATIERTEHGVRIQYDGIKVLDFHLSNLTCTRRTNWADYWGQEVEKVEFHGTLDTASKSCRVQTPPEPPTPQQLRPWTVSPRKGKNWYGTYPASVEPTKNRFVEECWMKGAAVTGAALKESDWESRADCESECVQEEGCHVISHERHNSNDRGRCVLKGVYNIWQHPSIFDVSRWLFAVAERKCFDPDNYDADNYNPGNYNSESPCGGENWECTDRCIELEWRCDGEFDCHNGEDEERCVNYNSPLCPPGQWNCFEHHLCPATMSRQDLYDGRHCDRCIPKEYKCNGWSNCYFDEDERDCTELY